ncbi:deoxynucleotidyltransferase terminal-interacting protein 2 [Amborella trichopoda]|uniref:deoxynucleotidyltransferase terminal-interacting protein 2 n=1 Tax=Amborella trichopoda TaxID=13333 RepID=UPI0009BD305C|nr:deoxynucleotidyltransferase terminal-interacting protein 2 [Amborella trichopoda]|eukprot:XP_020521690.1 deoxynucleotidyltransferase terminal-interacting protein 2 [Amborella trichopoda]
MSGSKTSFELSWAPKVNLVPNGTKETLEKSKSDKDLVDGLFVPPRDPKKLNKLLRKQVKDTAGQKWFDMPAAAITPELKKDLQIVKLRAALDPKRHYKKGSSEVLPKYFQSVID